MELTTHWCDTQVKPDTMLLQRFFLKERLSTSPYSRSIIDTLNPTWEIVFESQASICPIDGRGEDRGPSELCQGSCGFR